jgi:hypothetical protein
MTMRLSLRSGFMDEAVARLAGLQEAAFDGLFDMFTAFQDQGEESFSILLGREGRPSDDWRAYTEGCRHFKRTLDTGFKNVQDYFSREGDSECREWDF